MPCGKAVSHISHE